MLYIYKTVQVKRYENNLAQERYDPYKVRTRAGYDYWDVRRQSGQENHHHHHHHHRHHHSTDRSYNNRGRINVDKYFFVNLCKCTLFNKLWSLII